MRFWILCGLNLTLALATGCGRNRPSTPSQASVPEADVLLIITLDTTRADHLSCYGKPAVKTPHLDALAARGALFAQAIVQVPLTLASHACILAGA